MNTYIAVSGDVRKGLDFHGPYNSWDQARDAHGNEFVCIVRLNSAARDQIVQDENNDEQKYTDAV